ncbi:MAG: SRPBCC family protein [Gaiellaceae bacterium]
MPQVDESIDVRVPVEQAYNQWTQFEEFPKFMEGIQSVQQLDHGHVKWVAEVRGETREWTTEITEQRPDEKIAWKTISGEVKNDGIVTFEQLGTDQTRINVEMDVEGESRTENVAGDLLGLVKTQVRSDLERFKQLIESRGEETDAWRGEVQDGETH